MNPHQSRKLDKVINKVLNEDEGLANVYSMLGELRTLKAKQADLTDQVRQVITRLIHDLGEQVRALEIQDEQIPQLDIAATENGLTVEYAGDLITLRPDFGIKQWIVDNPKFARQFGDLPLRSDVAPVAAQIIK